MLPQPADEAVDAALRRRAREGLAHRAEVGPEPSLLHLRFNTPVTVAKFGKISAKCCSFSAVSAPIFASKYALCSIFQNLPDYLAEIFEIWQNFVNFATFAKCLLNFTKNADFSNRFVAKILRVQRCKSMQILWSLKNAVERIFSCKISF